MGDSQPDRNKCGQRKVINPFKPKTLQVGGNRLMLVGVEPGVIKTMKKAGTLDEIGSDNVFPVQPA
ncbi:MAG: hypothetical protein U9R57_09820 [Thermodesulfobacteriota bacterium]|nr:hypothetical protein [Thermodesulfobacteriota bacterium]